MRRSRAWEYASGPPSSGTSSPSLPWVMISPGPCGQSVATTGTPQCIASTMVIPKDSLSEETAAMAPLLHSVSIGETGPIRKMRL